MHTDLYVGCPSSINFIECEVRVYDKREIKTHIDEDKEN